MLAIIHLLGTFVASLLKSRRQLEIENLFLRHQLNVALRRAPHRLRLRHSDRVLIVWMTRFWPSLLRLSRVVQPDTILRWHRAGFRAYWRWKSRARRFEVTATEIYVDSEKKTAAVRLQSHLLTDRGGGEYRQHCVWFVYFNDDNKITRIVDYSDTKLVDEMIIRVATAKMKALRYTSDARIRGTKSRVRAGYDETLHDH